METTNETTFSKYKDLGLTGLANLGNTCFLNSTVQCISHTYELNELFDKDNSKKQINKDETELLVFNEWNELRKLMWSSNCKISPAKFVSSIQNVARFKNREIFTGFAQNDLPEFLLFFMDEIHNAFKRSVKMKITGKESNNKDKLAKLCYKMLETMYSKEYSEIVDLFYGIYVSQIYNMNGEEVLAQTAEPFFIVNLPIPPKRNPTIYECFDLYTSKETLDGENKWYNDDKKEHQEADKQIQFFSLPKILVVDFKRFDNTAHKNRCLIDFPLDNLDLSKYVIGYNEESYIYECYGVCNHSGTALGGHYTSYVKNANGKWYHFNDTQVSEMKKEESVISTKAYCLFYRKKNK